MPGSGNLPFARLKATTCVPRQRPFQYTWPYVSSAPSQGQHAIGPPDWSTFSQNSTSVFMEFRIPLLRHPVSTLLVRHGVLVERVVLIGGDVSVVSSVPSTQGGHEYQLSFIFFSRSASLPRMPKSLLYQ